MRNTIETGVRRPQAIDMVVFDVAGTTVWDGTDPVARSVCAALAEVGVGLPIQAVDPLMGRAKPLAILELLRTARGTEPDAGEVDRVHESFRRHVMSYYRTDPQVREMPGAEWCFGVLRDAGVRVTLDTGFDRQTLEVILDRMGWHGLVDDTITSDEVAHGRPAPDMVRELMRRGGITDAAAVCKVGDSISDLEEGINAGCGLVVGVLSERTRPVLGRFPGVVAITNPGEVPTLLGLASGVRA